MIVGPGHMTFLWYLPGPAKQAHAISNGSGNNIAFRYGSVCQSKMLISPNPISNHEHASPITNQGQIGESIHCNLTVVAQSIHVSPSASKFESNRPKIKPKLFFSLFFWVWVVWVGGWLERMSLKVKLHRWSSRTSNSGLCSGWSSFTMSQCYKDKWSWIRLWAGSLVEGHLGKTYGYFPRHYWYKLLPWISWMFLTEAWQKMLILKRIIQLIRKHEGKGGESYKLSFSGVKCLFFLICFLYVCCGELIGIWVLWIEGFWFVEWYYEIAFGFLGVLDWLFLFLSCPCCNKILLLRQKKKKCNVYLFILYSSSIFSNKAFISQLNFTCQDASSRFMNLA